ncbi:helix-turn-helix domain-containing protein [Actinoallomurus sp. NPDC052308]|uniref:helix-turn-helix domain-containing protein n=1 Tax=Actinoallomurus sp. NPDC052308 TaxID=3155530 RepID=UPI0034367AFF
MGAWSPLPDTLEPQVRHLTVRLRALKDRTGLSLAALARKTSCSKSAWSRYLGGQVLPPRDVVAALGALAGADEAPLMALWELAEAARSRRDGTTPPAVPTREGQRTGPDPDDRSALAEADPDDRRALAEADPDDRPALAGPSPSGPERPRSGKRALAVATGAAVLAVGGLTTALALTSSTSPRAGRIASPGPPTPAATSRCHRHDCTAAVLGCDRDAVTTAALPIGHADLEIRYSAACKAAWAQLTGSHRYDRLEFTGGPHTRTVKAKVRVGTGAVTPVVAVSGPSTGVACVQLSIGTRRCTHPPAGSGSG